MTSQNVLLQNGVFTKIDHKKSLTDQLIPYFDCLRNEVTDEPTIPVPYHGFHLGEFAGNDCKVVIMEDNCDR